MIPGILHTSLRPIVYNKKNMFVFTGWPSLTGASLSCFYWSLYSIVIMFYHNVISVYTALGSLPTCAFSESASMLSRYRTVEMTPRFPNAPVDGLVAHSCTIHHRQEECGKREGARANDLATTCQHWLGCTYGSYSVLTQDFRGHSWRVVYGRAIYDMCGSLPPTCGDLVWDAISQHPREVCR